MRGILSPLRVVWSPSVSGLSRGGWFLLWLPALLLLACAGGKEPDSQAFQTLFDKGRAYLQRGNAQMALPALQQANLLQPGHVELLTLLGLAYDQLERPVQALDSLEEAHRLRPLDGNLNHNLGVACLRVYGVSCTDNREEAGCSGRLDQAEAALQAALRDPALNAPEGVWFHLSLVYKQRGQTQQRVAALEKVLAISGHYLPARLELADYYRVLGHFDLERQQLRAALAAYPDTLVVLERLVDSLFAMGQSGDTDPLVALSPGERREIRTWLDRILSLAPGTLSAQRASQRILLLDRKR